MNPQTSTLPAARQGTAMTRPAQRAPLTPELAAQLSEASTRGMTAFQNASKDGADVLAALEVAGAIEDMRLAMNDPAIRQRIVALQDTPLGFRTDRDPKTKRKGSEEYNTPYPWDTTRDCSLEAALRGLQLVGNMFNIISGRCYITLEGFAYLIRRLPNITDYQVTIAVPRNQNGGAIVDFEASWLNSGKAQSLKGSVAVKTDTYSGADQIIGKATRKLSKRVFEMMGGAITPEGDADDSAGLLPETTTAGGALTESTAARIAAATPATPRAARKAIAPAAAAAVDATSETKPATPPPATASPEAKTVTAPPVSGPPAQQASPPAGAFVPTSAPASTAEDDDIPFDPDPKAPVMKPTAEVEIALEQAGVSVTDFIRWLKTTGELTEQTGKGVEAVHQVPESVLVGILSNDRDRLKRCIRICA